MAGRVGRFVAPLRTAVQRFEIRKLQRLPLLSRPPTETGVSGNARSAATEREVLVSFSFIL